MSDEIIKADIEEDRKKDFIEHESWLRQKRESNAAYNAFCIYRDYGGDRSIVKAIEKAGFPKSRSGIWCAWSNKYQWVRRAGAYDNFLDSVRLKEREEAYRQREKKHLELSVKMLSLVEKRLSGFDPEELSQAKILDWLKGCVDLERLAYSRESGAKDEGTKQLEIAFFEDFDGV